MDTRRNRVQLVGAPRGGLPPPRRRSRAVVMVSCFDTLMRIWPRSFLCTVRIILSVASRNAGSCSAMQWTNLKEARTSPLFRVIEAEGDDTDAEGDCSRASADARDEEGDAAAACCSSQYAGDSGHWSNNGLSHTQTEEHGAAASPPFSLGYSRLPLCSRSIVSRSSSSPSTNARRMSTASSAAGSARARESVPPRRRPADLRSAREPRGGAPGAPDSAVTDGVRSSSFCCRTSDLLFLYWYLPGSRGRPRHPVSQPVRAHGRALAGRRRRGRTPP